MIASVAATAERNRKTEKKEESLGWFLSHTGALTLQSCSVALSSWTLQLAVHQLQSSPERVIFSPCTRRTTGCHWRAALLCCSAAIPLARYLVRLTASLSEITPDARQLRRPETWNPSHQMGGHQLYAFDALTQGSPLPAPPKMLRAIYIYGLAYGSC